MVNYNQYHKSIKDKEVYKNTENVSVYCLNLSILEIQLCFQAKENWSLT